MDYGRGGGTPPPSPEGSLNDPDSPVREATRRYLAWIPPDADNIEEASSADSLESDLFGSDMELTITNEASAIGTNRAQNIDIDRLHYYKYPSVTPGEYPAFTGSLGHRGVETLAGNPIAHRNNMRQLESRQETRQMHEPLSGWAENIWANAVDKPYGPTVSAKSVRPHRFPSPEPRS